MTIQDLENKYPKRNLSEEAEVVRVSPSPTGFVHLGLLYMATICQRIAENSKGVFILRIEDTDTAREVSGAKWSIVEKLYKFNIKYNEGLLFDMLDLNDKNRLNLECVKGDNENRPVKLSDVGEYGPYVQSERKDIYDVCIDYLLSVGRAYKCYMTVEELTAMREDQTINKVRPGVYGEYAKWRPDTAMARMGEKEYKKYIEENNENSQYIIRFLSKGNELNKFKFHDEILGDMMVPENDEDFVLRKADGLPTYHLAHVVDDHFMRTTFVLRGNEWWASLGKHVELWDAFGWTIPKYGHLQPINKSEATVDENGMEKLTVRKLSKRKDKEADVQFFLDQGYMTEAVNAYLLRIMNPSFDDWMSAKVKAGEKINIKEFPFNIKELSRGGRGPLLDIPKLDNIASEIFSYVDNIDLEKMVRAWAINYDRVLFTVLADDIEYNQKVFAIERLHKDITTNTNTNTNTNTITKANKIRKDIVKLSDIRRQYYYFWDYLYTMEKKNRQIDNNFPFSSSIAKELKEKIKYMDMSNIDVWLTQMKEYSVYFGYDKFANFMRDLRLAITLEERTPNIYDVMIVMGIERVINRL